MKNIFVLGAVFAATATVSVAQETDTTLIAQKWDITQCIEQAKYHNLRVGQAMVDIETAKIGVQTAKLDFLPSLGASSNVNANFGRALDPTTYQFSSNETVVNFSAGAQASATIFGGMSKHHNLDKSKLAQQTAQKSVEQLQDELTIAVAGSYLQILFNKEMVETSKSQIELIEEQVVRLKQKVEAGMLPLGDLMEIEAQLSAEKYNLVSLNNQHATSKLTLMQLMEIRSFKDFDIVVPVIDTLTPFSMTGFNEVYSKALNLARIEVADLQNESSKKDVSLAKAALYPTLNFSANYGSSWSDARKKPSMLPDGTTIYGKYPFGDQFLDNAAGAVGVSLVIPIFNGLKSQNGVRNAVWRQKKSEIALLQVKDVLYKEIQQAYLDAMGSYEKYVSATESVESTQESFNYADVRFASGATTSLDYNTAKNKLIQAISQQLSSKYEYIFKLKILEFYVGNPIVL